MLSFQLQELFVYPQRRWATDISERWVSLCNGLREYEAPDRLLVFEAARKWELVSAFQKSIRRADRVMALRLVSAMASMPEEYGHFWRRLCVIACEDVGPADDVLTSFVVACATVFLPKKIAGENYRIMCFLASQMCEPPNRSRIYCRYGAIESAALKSDLPELTLQDDAIVAAIMQQSGGIQVPENSWREWQMKNDWRTDGLLKFVGLTLPLPMIQSDAPLPPSKVLFDLPSYCYDMHTRVGLNVLQRLVRGVAGAEGIKEFFQENRIKDAHRALGEMLFTVEGGRIKGELLYEPLCSLEQRLYAHQFGLPFDKWTDLRILMGKALDEGIVDRVREEVLMRYYGQEQLQLIAPDGD
jgi:hypothetical protein